MPTQTSVPFPSFPSANRPQAALHYREACPSVFCERLPRILQPGVCTQACRVFPATFCCPARTQSHGFGCTGGTLHTLRQSLWRKIFAQHREGQSIPAGLGISTAAESSSSWTAIAHLSITCPWANTAPGLLFPAHSVPCFPEFMHLKKAQVSTEISLHSGSLCSAPCLGGAMRGVCGFRPTIGQVSNSNLSTELSS